MPPPRVTHRRRNLIGAWVLAAALVGLVFGFAPCRDGADLTTILVAIGGTVALVQVVILAHLGVHPLRWFGATVIGVYLVYWATFASLLAEGAVAQAVAVVMFGWTPSSFSGPSPLWASVVVLGLACFGGGSVLGVLQYFALPRRSRTRAWVPLTMLGTVAVAPLAFTLVGLFLDCRHPLLDLPVPLLGTLGGACYGALTAIGLSRVIRLADR